MVIYNKQEVVGSNPAQVDCGCFFTDTRKSLSVQYFIHYVGVRAESDQISRYWRTLKKTWLDLPQEKGSRGSDPFVGHTDPETDPECESEMSFWSD